MPQILDAIANKIVPYNRNELNSMLNMYVKKKRRDLRKTEDAYSSGHLVLSNLGLAFVLMLRPFFPEHVMSTDLLSFEHPAVLLVC